MTAVPVTGRDPLRPRPVGVRIRDIAPRLAGQANAIATGLKVELVDRLTAAGIRAVEVSSFVRPDLVPNLADADEVFARVRRPEGVWLECCVANLAGFRRAVDAGAHVAWFLLSADEQFSLLNTGRTIEQSLEVLARLRETAEGTGTRLGTYLIAAWGGPAGPARPAGELARLLDRVLRTGVDEWILADSCGYAAPAQIRETVLRAEHLTPLAALAVQIHDSRGMGVAGVLEAARIGVRRIDTALAGSGGHPAAPAARVGGVCTEDAVQALELSGHTTGIDLDALIDTANWFDTVLARADQGAHQTAHQGPGSGPGFVRHTGRVPAGRWDRSARRPSFDWSR